MTDRKARATAKATTTATADPYGMTNKRTSNSNDDRKGKGLVGKWAVYIPPVGYFRLHPPTHSPAWRRGRAPLERATGLVDSKPRRPVRQSSLRPPDEERTSS